MNLASQKNYISLYLSCVYCDPKLAKSFEKQWRATGKKLDMGKSCVRFKDVDDLALDAIVDAISATTIDDYIAQYEKARGSARTVRDKKAGAAKKKRAAKKTPTKRKPPR